VQRLARRARNERSLSALPRFCDAFLALSGGGPAPQTPNAPQRTFLPDTEDAKQSSTLSNVNSIYYNLWVSRFVTAQRTWNCGRVRSRLAYGSVTPWSGHARFWRDMRGNSSPPTMLRIGTEHSWRCRESNPGPSVPHQDFSERSLHLLFSAPAITQARRRRAQPLLDVLACPAAGPASKPSS
jgi:hypothetical protein